MPKPVGPALVPVIPSTTTPSSPAAPTAPATPTAPAGWGPRLPDPQVAKKHRDVATWVPTQGTAIKNGVSPDDALQGSLGNCYLVSGLSSLANVQPDVIRNAIRENADGTYTVKFHKDSFLGLFTRGQKELEITVDGDMPTKDGKTPLYAHGRDVGELWPLIIEKAYAKLDGGYQRVGVGGSPVTIWQALTGKSGAMTANAVEGEGSLFRKMKNALDEKRPVAASTAPFLRDYEGTGLAKGHVYAVLGVSEKDGQKFVQLRNPWGHGEPAGDGKDDGQFSMPLAEFKKQFAFTYFGG
ncbi:MAG: hypothetical protein JNM69_00775 [Archangium sp.]|nr:hypothetical protein [Archangium sp.]